FRSRDLGPQLLVARVEEVDHARRPERNLPHRFGRPDRQGREEVFRRTHTTSMSVASPAGPGVTTINPTWPGTMRSAARGDKRLVVRRQGRTGVGWRGNHPGGDGQVPDRPARR